MNDLVNGCTTRRSLVFGVLLICLIMSFHSGTFSFIKFHAVHFTGYVQSMSLWNQSQALAHHATYTHRINQYEYCELNTDNLNHLPPCSDNIFREYYTSQRKFPECGQWITKNKTNTFYTNLCQWKLHNLQKCLYRKDIGSILVIGDSNGLRYFRAWVKKLKESGSHCKKVKGEVQLGHGKSIPQASYFAQGDPLLQQAIEVQARGCRTCSSETQLCTLPLNRDQPDQHFVKIEYTSMVFFNDTSIKIVIPENTSHSLKIPLAKTFPEFLFKVYLQKKYPDVIFFHPPFNHEKKFDTSLVTTKLQKVLHIILQYKAPHTQVVWVPGTAEFEARRPHRASVYINKTYNGMLATDKIYTLNRKLFDILEQHLLNPESKMTGFFNMINMSMTRDKWSLDGVHFNAAWYTHIVQYVSSVLCAQ